MFVVHGHDHSARNAVTRFLRDLGLEAVVLDEQPSGGLTVIEKFEKYSKRVRVAIGILTPDDLAHPKDEPQRIKFRARQNVIFELGFFVGHLGRSRVVALFAPGDADTGMEIPSDYNGVMLIPIDPELKWRVRLIQELEAAGLDGLDKNAALLRN